MKSRIKIIFSMLIFGSLGVFVTRLSLPTGHIVFVRAAIACLALFLILKIKGKGKSKLSASSFMLLLFLGGLIGINWLLLFEAYKYIYVSTATLLYYTQPVFLIILGRIFLKEKLTWKKFTAILLAIIGMFFINGFSVSGADSKRGVFLALGAAILYAIIVLINKASKDITNADGLVVTDIQMLGAAIVMGVYTFLKYDGEFAVLDKESIIILVILGLVHTALAYYLYFTSIKSIDAQSVAVLGYIDPASALVFSAIFLDERLGVLQWIGAGLIALSAIISQLKSGK